MKFVSFNAEINPIESQFDDPTYPVSVKVNQGSTILEDVVVYTRNIGHGHFDFGKLEPVITHWPPVQQSTLKDRIKKAINECLNNDSDVVTE